VNTLEHVDPRDRPIVPSEVGRTAFRRYSNWRSTFGYTHPHIDKNLMCIMCKTEDNEPIRDIAELKPWTDFFAGKTFEGKPVKFTATRCHVCGYPFSFYWPA